MFDKIMRRLYRHATVYIMMPLFNRRGTRYYLSHRPDFSSRLDREEIAGLAQLWEHGQRGNNRGDWTRLYCFVSSIEDLHRRNVPGAIAELGVYKGTTARILKTLMPGRNLYLFDTFEGFSERDTKVDPSGIDAGHYAGSLAEVQKFVGVEDNIRYCPGIFPDTACMVPDDERFALVHLDCDLYEPTKAACEFFYDRLQPGGLLIIHDYHSGCWPGVQQAVDEYFESCPEKPVLIPDKSGTAILVKNTNIIKTNKEAGAFGAFLALFAEAHEGAALSYAALAFI